VKIEPLHDQVAIKKDEAGPRTAGGLYIPPSAQEKAVTGEVIAVGPGRITETGQHVPMQVKVGDRVLFGAYVGLEMEVDKHKVFIVEERNLLAKVAR